MHVVFIPYGKRSELELLLRDMEAQKHQLRMYKGDKKKFIWVQGSIRLLPFGIYEYIFPEEDADLVLNTLDFNNNRYQISWLKLEFLKKLVSVDKIPDYKTNKKYLWIKDHVNIIPLGVRYDAKDITEEDGPYKGWTHEAL